MKVNDFISARVNLSNLKENNKYQKGNNNKEILYNFRQGNDLYIKEKNYIQDSYKINELQKDYIRNLTELNGLNELRKRVNQFEVMNDREKNYQNLSRELNNIVKSVKYNGESIISYLSTEIYDDKTLYTFKVNLNNEIEKMQNKIKDDRKKIAMHLIRNENIDNYKGFSSENALNNIKEYLNKNQNIENLFVKKISLNKLLNNENS